MTDRIRCVRHEMAHEARYIPHGTDPPRGGRMIIGFLGAGQMAQTLARVWLRAGHRVLLANSRGPGTLADLVEDLGPGAAAVTPAELRAADVIVLAIRWAQLPEAVPLIGPLDAKVVVDPTNNFVDDQLVDLGGRRARAVGAAGG